MTASRRSSSLIDPSLLTRDFLLLVVGHFLQALGYSSMLLLPLYLAHLGASRTEIGTVMAVASVGGLLCRPLIGWSLDALGRRVTLVVGTVTLSLGMASFALVDRMGWLVYADRILVGIGTGTLFTGYFAFATDIIPAQRRTQGIALFGISGLAPLLVNPFADSIGIDPPELRWFFPLLGVFILGSLIPLWLVRERSTRGAWAPLTVPSVLAALRHPAVRPSWLATATLGALVGVFMAFATVTAARRGVSWPAGLWLTYALGAATVRLLTGRLFDSIGPRRLLPPALLAYALAAVVAAMAHSAPAFLFAGLLGGVAHGLGFPSITSLVTSHMPENMRGSGLAMLTALWDASMLVFTPAFGAVADAFADGIMFACLAACAVLALAWWWRLERALPAL